MRKAIKRIDPAGCGCTDCQTGFSKPMNIVDAEEIMLMLQGHIDNATYFANSDFEECIVITLSTPTGKKYTWEFE